MLPSRTHRPSPSAITVTSAGSQHGAIRFSFRSMCCPWWEDIGYFANSLSKYAFFSVMSSLMTHATVRIRFACQQRRYTVQSESNKECAESVFGPVPILEELLSCQYAWRPAVGKVWNFWQSSCRCSVHKRSTLTHRRRQQHLQADPNERKN